MAISDNIYTEFIEDNLYKRYPFTDSYNGDIPDSFIGDLKIVFGLSPISKYRDTTYVSMVHVYPDYIYVYISTDDDGVIAQSDPIPTSLTMSDSDESRTIPIRPTSSIPVNGTLVVGTCSDMAKQQGVIETTGYIFPANISVIPEQVYGIKVGETVLTGDINIKSGDGVILSVDTSTNTITVNRDASNDKELADPAKALMDKFIEKYGQPIISVNGIKPNNTGNIELLPTDCLMIETDYEHSTVSLYNPCGTTCASEQFMEDTYTRIDDLNKNYKTLSDFYMSVSNTLAQMAARVSAVLEIRADTLGTTANK